MTSAVPDIAGRVVRWQASHGRSTLPWQNTRDPYRVWLSEIMLQQTQVKTVLAYYDRFLQRFPDVQALAAASLDDVLGHWSGLGYYSRARNLHRCAQAVVQQHGGQFPRSAAQLQELPGIGRSTAAAIASFCWDERSAILDGNVKRVLTRALAFGGDLAQLAAERALWDKATQLLPEAAADMPRYTQGLMDLGATVCLSRQPSCLLCPLEPVCEARKRQEVDRYPVKTRKLKRTAQSLWLLRARSAEGEVFLEKRPTPGVWAGLYCLPVFDSRESLEQAMPARLRERLDDEPAFVHVLTHKDLHLHPVALTVEAAALKKLQGTWFGRAEWPALGLPTPVRRLLSEAG
ncbi:A/G-specific adenine glycosylase [Ramlibacter humi]|uniref:Adenine DNA glycosylase n=1 Tax=Ramlibacter humi TaxID=2530451 RepID=A0A4Z0BYW7_9BURK|nr:A/G-specific adenine glycosylase [Ramlibacter humi]TFZ03724.1 A/G-specific adenine glycosylase [Ramlibacter humi]